VDYTPGQNAKVEAGHSRQRVLAKGGEVRRARNCFEINGLLEHSVPNWYFFGIFGALFQVREGSVAPLNSGARAVEEEPYGREEAAACIILVERRRRHCSYPIVYQRHISFER
jgi:hypothetical protein